MSDKIDARISPALHPANVAQIDGYDADTAPVLAATMTAFDEAYRGIGQVFTAREKAKTNPTWNEALQLIHTQDLADKVLTKVAKGFDTTRANLERGIAFLEGELSQPVTTKAAGSIAAEIRAHVKALPTAKLHDFIQAAIAGDDHDTVSSLLGAPAYLSGLTPEFQKIYLRQYHEKNNPDKAKRLTAMRGAKAMIEERAGLVFKGLEQAVGAAPHRVKALREAKTNAEQAFVLKDLWS